MHKKTMIVGLVAAAGLTSAAMGSTPSIEYATIAANRLAAPGPDGATFGLLLVAPVINSKGDVAFAGSFQPGLAGIGALNNTALWAQRDGQLELIAQEGSAAPGVLGAGFERPSGVVINDDGDVAFVSALRGNVSGADDSGLWLATENGVQLVAREGALVPGSSTLRYGEFTAANEVNPSVQPLLNIGGRVAFDGLLRGEGQTSGGAASNWSTLGGAVTPVSAAGLGAPGTGGARFDSPAPGTLTIDGAGNIAFLGSLVTGEAGVDSSNDTGIWATRGGGLALVAREGSNAPGTGGVYNSFEGAPGVNFGGDLAFAATTRGVQETAGIWVSRSGATPQLTVQAGDGTSEAGGAALASFRDPILNRAGDLAFLGTLATGSFGVTAGNNDGIWTERGGDLSLIAREGTGAAGSNGALFDTFDQITFNAQGDVAFNAFLRLGEEGVDGSNDQGLWAYSAVADELLLVAREGDLFDVNPDPAVEDLRTIRAIRFVGDSGLSDGRAAGFNDSGVLAFGLSFTNGTTGIFTARIPAPGTAGLLACAALVAGARRRRG